MSQKVQHVIVVQSKWVVVPYLLVFCLVALGNVANHWSIPNIIVFVAQSLVILCDLFTILHVASFFSLAQDDDVSNDLITALVIGGIVAIVAIPLSFFVGWILFALAFVLLLYHVGMGIYLALPDSSKQKEQM